MTLETEENIRRHGVLVAYLRAVLPLPVDGHVFVAASQGAKNGRGEKMAMSQEYAHTHEALADALLTASDDGRDSYFALGRYEPHTAESGRPGRRGKFVRALKSFWVDIDCGATKAAEGNGYATKEDAVAAIKAFFSLLSLPAPTHVIDSGGGIHAYWALDSEIAPDEWKRVSDILKVLAEAHGFLADPARTADLASVMRAPLTLNRKFEPPRNATILRERPTVPFALLAGALTSAHAQHFGKLEHGASTKNTLAAGNLLPAASRQRPAESPEEIARVKAMLAVIPADLERAVWRDIVWATADTGWTCAKELAHDWSARAPEKFSEASFVSVWNSFDPAGGIGFGTLEYYARQYGYVSKEPARFDWTGADVDNGRRFAKTYRGKYLFVDDTGGVLEFDPNAGWVLAPPCAAESAAKAVRDQIREEAAELYKANPESPLTKRAMAEAARVSKAPNLHAMVEMAKSEPGMTRSLNDFDADPMQLGVANGVLDLERLLLMPVSPNLLVTKRCNVAYDPAATCPQWERFLIDVQPDAAVREFLQRWVGYCLTGLVREQKFIFAHGGGANGKSVLVETVAWLMGDYARKVATEMLMQHQRNPQGPSPDIVSLKGMRFVYANETEEGRKLADARIKDMTGGDTLTGRIPYAKTDITFSPTHKLVLVGNHKPEISDTSQGMWRRVCLVLFDVTVPASQRDGKLPEKLKREGAGILNWALRGLRKYLSDGLAIPKQIEVATAAYRDEQDIVRQWVSECCTEGPSRKMKKDDAYRSYRSWCESNGHRPMAKGRFTRRLGACKYPLLPDKRTIGGVALKQVDTVTAAP